MKRQAIVTAKAGLLWDDNNKGKGESWLGRAYIPTHRGETAMDGAPEVLWLGGEGGSCFARMAHLSDDKTVAKMGHPAVEEVSGEGWFIVPALVRRDGTVCSPSFQRVLKSRR